MATLLALLVAFSAGDIPLPRDLADDREFALAAPDPQQKVDLMWSVGGHLGVASSFDSDDAAFLIGGHGRVRILPWLGAEARLDFQTPQSYESGDVDVDVFAIQVSALFYLPIDWPVKPYGIAGVGFYIVDVSYSGALGYKKDTTDVEVGFHIGGGAEYWITPTIALDADIRFVFITGSAAGNDFNYFQFTAGISFKIG